MKSSRISFLLAMFCVLPCIGGEFQKLPAASIFDAGKLPRDPFAPVTTDQSHEASIHLGSDMVEEAQLARFFRVSAFSIDRLAIALINGTAVAEGESFTVRVRGGNLRIRLLKVKQNGVVLKSSGTIFNVPITR